MATCNDKVTISEKTGRMANGINADHGVKTHARINGSNKALCGTEPGRRADWSSYGIELSYMQACNKADSLITCVRCRTALYKWDERPRFGCDTISPF